MLGFRTPTGRSEWGKAACAGTQENCMARALPTEPQWQELAQAARYNAVVLAKLCKLTTRQLQRRFRHALGCSPQAWLDGQRILAAKQLLLSGYSVKGTASELHFKQTSHFCRQFKMSNDMTALEFVALHRVNGKGRSQITDVAHR